MLNSEYIHTLKRNRRARIKRSYKFELKRCTQAIRRNYHRGFNKTVYTVPHTSEYCEEGYNFYECCLYIYKRLQKEKESENLILFIGYEEPNTIIIVHKFNEKKTKSKTPVIMNALSKLHKITTNIFGETIDDI